ncbi:hypothetical protein GTA08_BOTSDO10772 [Neofusicoccum parvum]|uniref:Inheritance of peroxisomes protein 1 n=1 Tax=Botryosphaeria parva (strain UCR-NP2) TaxID=1287680 RepID=R1EKL0_BOTPV|nr:hypothetical protein UCRNP2_5195 [Neofusicoccum parvum UCRNP2]GME40588.1 hypothetical protein GTA08_BOTSDO10772 [Neofusicoccum parvum]
MSDSPACAMSTPTAPSTPTSAPPPANRGVRRSFTLPTRFASPTTPSESPASADGVETLFNHSFAKVVLFTTAASLSRPSSSASNRTVLRDRGSHGHPETIPWVSPTESTVAAGPIRIYRVPGSVAFLHSGSLLHAILPKSQCWCVDGVSKFAMRIPRPNSYYRIELPGEGEDNLAKVEEFKAVMEKILLYEKTVCPFTRGFHVEVPEVPATPPRKKRPATPGRAKKWKLDGIWKPEDAERPAVDGGSDQDLKASPGTRHKREISELTITAHMHLSEDERSPFSPPPRAEERPTSAPPTPTLTSDSDSAVDMSYPDIDPPPETIRLRRLTSTSHLRAFSPMPHPANLFTPPAQSHPKKQYTSAIMQKTIGLLVGPPAHLVALMLRIAASIATGVFTPDSWSLRRGKKIPGAWQWSEDEDEWDDEDDYGIPLGSYRRRGTDASDVD